MRRKILSAKRPLKILGGIFDKNQVEIKLDQIEKTLQNENFWKDPRQGQTRWDGSVCDQLILWDDQGFGDTLQNLSWITEAASRVGRLRIWLRPALLPLVRTCLSLPVNCQLEALDPQLYLRLMIETLLYGQPELKEIDWRVH